MQPVVRRPLCIEPRGKVLQVRHVLGQHKAGAKLANGDRELLAVRAGAVALQVGQAQSWKQHTGFDWLDTKF